MGFTGTSRGMIAGICALLVMASGCLRSQPAPTEEQKRERIAALYERYRSSFAEVEGVSVERLLELQRGEEPVVLVDVRSAVEREVSMIPGAISVEAFERDHERYRGSRIVTYCTIGYRSGLYASGLLRQGWQALNLEGSILAWTHAGQPLVDAAGPTRRVHVYGSDWDLTAADYEPVW